MAADLLKYADMDSRGNDNKNNPCIVKILLANNTPLEMASIEGNTPLLRAVKNTEIIQMLLVKKAKVTALDKQGKSFLMKKLQDFHMSPLLFFICLLIR